MLFACIFFLPFWIKLILDDGWTDYGDSWFETNLIGSRFQIGSR